MGFLYQRSGKTVTVCETLCATASVCAPTICASGTGGWTLRTGGCIYSAGRIRSETDVYSNVCLHAPYVCGTTCLKSPVVCATGDVKIDETLRFTQNTPYLCTGGAYIVVPSGIYVSGGTIYAENTIMARNGICDDTGNPLTIFGGTNSEKCTVLCGKTFSCTCLQSPIVCATTKLGFGACATTHLCNNGNYMRVQTQYGYADIGPGNASWSHFYTDRGGWYFDKKICSACCVLAPFICASAVCAASYIRTAGDLCAVTGGSGRQLYICDSGTGAMLKADAGNSRAFLLLDEDSSDGIGAGSDYAYLGRTGGNTTLDNSGGGKVLISTAGVVRLCSDSSLTCAAVQIQSPIVCATTCLAGKKTILDSSGDYVWCATCTAATYSPRGISTSFVRAAQGWQNYGTVLHVGGRGGNDAGGDFQLYMGHGHNYGGIHLQVRSANNDASPSDSWTTWKTLLDSCNISCGGATHVCGTTCIQSPIICATTCINSGNVGIGRAASNYPLMLKGNTPYQLALCNSGAGDANYPWLVHRDDNFIIHFNAIADRFYFHNSGAFCAGACVCSPIVCASGTSGYTLKTAGCIYSNSTIVAAGGVVATGTVCSTSCVRTPVICATTCIGTSCLCVTSGIQRGWCTLSLTSGDYDKFYPIGFCVSVGHHADNIVEIVQSNLHSPASSCGAMYLKFQTNITGWGHISSGTTVLSYKRGGSNILVSKIRNMDHNTGKTTVWLRGGVNYCYRSAAGGAVVNFTNTSTACCLSYDNSNNAYDVYVQYVSSIVDSWPNRYNESSHCAFNLTTATINTYLANTAVCSPIVCATETSGYTLRTAGCIYSNSNIVAAGAVIATGTVCSTSCVRTPVICATTIAKADTCVYAPVVCGACGSFSTCGDANGVAIGEPYANEGGWSSQLNMKGCAHAILRIKKSSGDSADNAQCLAMYVHDNQSAKIFSSGNLKLQAAGQLRLCMTSAQTCVIGPLNITTVGCANTCLKSPVVCSTTRANAPIVCGNTCVSGAVLCATTRAQSPTLCGTTATYSPILCGTSCVKTGRVCICNGDNYLIMVSTCDSNYNFSICAMWSWANPLNITSYGSPIIKQCSGNAVTSLWAAGSEIICLCSGGACVAGMVCSPIVCATCCLHVSNINAICLSHANPNILSGGSYISIPNGLYVSGGTFYAQNNMRARAGICNDSGILCLDGGNDSGKCTVLCGKTFSCTCLQSPIVCATTAIRGTHCGNGAGLTSLNASNLSSGTVAAARLPAAAKDYISGTAFSTNGPDSVLEYAQASGVTDTKIAPTTDWYNSIRMGHGDPYCYYSNTIAVKMTGSGSGTLYTQNIANCSAGGWKKHWNDTNDGAGSGLDADKLDGLQGGCYYRSNNPSGYTTCTGTSNVAIGCGSGNAHRGDHGVTAYNHSQAAHAPSNANYITNNNQLTNGAGYTTCTGNVVNGQATICASAVCSTACIMLSSGTNHAKICNSVGFVVMDSTEGLLVRDNSLSVFSARASGNCSLVALKACTSLTVSGASTMYGSLTVYGSMSKGSGCFRIPHPDPKKREKCDLVHSFVESPNEGDNIYRWSTETISGRSVIELPGYYRYLNKNDQVWVSPKNHFGSAYGEVTEDQKCLIICSQTDGGYNVLLIGTRKDDAVSSWSEPEIPAGPRPPGQNIKNSAI